MTPEPDSDGWTWFPTSAAYLEWLAAQPDGIRVHVEVSRDGLRARELRPGDTDPRRPPRPAQSTHSICRGCQRHLPISKMSGGPAEGWLCDPCEMAAFAEAG